jgi:type VI protein secretion system component VasF
MAGKTRLYQQTGSPLIQGSSRSDAPFWKVWLRSFLYGALLVWVALFIGLTLDAGSSGPGYVENVINSLVAMATAGLPGLLIGSWLGCVLSRGMGWRRTPLIAGATGALLGLATIYGAFSALGWPLVSF